MSNDEDICTCEITYNDDDNSVVIDPAGCVYSGHLQPCSHGRGELSGHEYGWIKFYRRPWRRLFRKQVMEGCFHCGEVRPA